MFEHHIAFDRDSSVPLSNQLYDHYRSAILGGRLGTGDKLPSSRQLARVLQVSRNTVTAAYELLRAEGLLRVRAGARPEVATLPKLRGHKAFGGKVQAAPTLSARGKLLAQNHRYMCASGRGPRMQPGEPSKALFPRDEWARCLRRAARTLTGNVLGYAHTSGLPQVQKVLAEYVAQERGVVCSPEQVFVFPSVQSILSLVSLCFAEAGEVALIEEPGYLGARSAFVGAGLDVRALSRADEIEEARLIYTTPSHQYPTGVRMEMGERLRLLQVAQHINALVLEDDYDSEFLFEGRPISALHGLSEENRVIYMGTSAKSLMPGLRLAYAVVPETHIEALEFAQRTQGVLANVHVQLAFADFIESGQFRAHLHRIRSAYHENGMALYEGLKARFGNQVGISRPTGGLQMPVFFSEAIDDVAVADRLNGKGFGVNPLSSFYLEAPKRGLVVGFAEADKKLRDAFLQEFERALTVAPGV